MPFLQIGYKRIHYSDLKPEGDVRETFIFMHGLGSSQDYYHPLTQYLLPKGFRCIIFDNTGAARSPYTFIEQSIQSLSDDVIGILDALEVSKAVFVGHSMGGIVGANLAAERSDRVMAAVLIGPVYPNDSVAPMFEKRIETVQREGMQAMLAVCFLKIQHLQYSVELHTDAHFHRRADTVPKGAPAKQASPLVRAFIRELLLSQEPAGYCSNCRVIINAKPPHYGKIQMPILILAGAEDFSAPLEGCKRMFDEMPSNKKRLEVMQGVGHWQCLEAPEEVGKLISSFYDENQ